MSASNDLRARPESRFARRPLLGAAATLALGAPVLGRVARRAPRAGELDLEDFLREAVPMARDLVGDTSRAGQERYLHSLAGLAALLGEVPVPEMRETTTKGATARTFIGENECDAPFVVLHWRMEPGARIGAHPHTYGNVVTLLLEGEVRIENHEMVGAPDFDTKEPFQVRRVNDHVLLPGDLNLVSLAHGYVHGFFAGAQGARGLDLTTRIFPKRSTPTLEVGALADEARRLWTARWKHE